MDGSLGSSVYNLYRTSYCYDYWADYYLEKKKILHSQRAHFKLNGEVTKTISKLGVDLFISQIAFGSISLIYNIFLGQYGGDIAISVYAIISSIMTFVIMPAGRLSQGIRPILGYCYGVKKYERVKYIMKVGCLISSTIMIFIWI